MDLKPYTYQEGDVIASGQVFTDGEFYPYVSDFHACVASSEGISYDELMKSLDTLRSMPPVLPPKVSFADLMKAQQDFYDSQKIRYSSNVKYVISKPKFDNLWEDDWYDKLFLHSYGLPMIPVDPFPLMQRFD